MNTNIKNLASVFASVIWADGVYDEAEKVTVEEIADALELDEAALKAEVDAQVEAVSAMNEEQLNAYLAEATEGIDDEDVALAYEAVMQLAVCDGVLTREEVELMLAIADALGIETADAVLMLADMVKSEEALEVSFEE